MAISQIVFGTSVFVGDALVFSVSIERGRYSNVHGRVTFNAADTDAGSTVDARVMVPHSNVLFINTIED